MIRRAISPRLATSIFLNIGLSRTNGEQPLAVFYRLAVFDEYANDLAGDFRFDLVHKLHRLDDAQHGPFFHDIAYRYKWSGVGRRGLVKGSHNRGFHVEQF